MGGEALNARLAMLLLLASGCGPMQMMMTEPPEKKPPPMCTSTDTWAGFGQDFFVRNCRTCHEHVDGFGTQEEVQATEAGITTQISSGAMPQNTVLSADDKRRVLAWLQCGAP